MTPSSPGCRSFVRVVESFLDGELEPSALIEGERHVASCAHCRERVALGRALKASVRELTCAPMGNEARSRLRKSMEAEMARTPSSRAAGTSSPRTRSAVVGLSFGLVAAIAAAFLVVPHLIPGLFAGPFPGLLAREAPREALAVSGDDDDALRELVAEHVHPLPMDGVDIQTVQGLEQYIGIPLRTHFPPSRARRVGARIVPVQKERAAIVQYELVPEGGGAGAPRRISVLVFDPRRIHLPSVLMRGDSQEIHQVRTTRTQGMPVAVMEDNGIGYALSGDVNEAQAVELVRYVASP